jgi:Conserved region of unknown function on GLTSCR protein
MFACPFVDDDRPKKLEVLTDAEQKAQKRQLELIEEDVRKVCNPNIAAPFSTIEDAVTRLLPYHVSRHPFLVQNPNTIRQWWIWGAQTRLEEGVRQNNEHLL